MDFLSSPLIQQYTLLSWQNSKTANWWSPGGLSECGGWGRSASRAGDPHSGVETFICHLSLSSMSHPALFSSSWRGWRHSTSRITHRSTASGARGMDRCCFTPWITRLFYLAFDCILSVGLFCVCLQKSRRSERCWQRNVWSYNLDHRFVFNQRKSSGN